MAIKHWLHNLVHREVTIAPLVTFRVVFGLLMFASIVRFWLYGWIEHQFVEPAFHFKYFGFHWVPDPSVVAIYGVFLVMAICALMIASGALYRIAAITFFFLFTYVELIDATYYLNHYYFVSLVSGIMIFLPANRKHALDVKWGLVAQRDTVPAIAINAIKVQLGLVYFLAGVAKLNSDWLFEAMPLAIWLPSQSHLPIIGDWLSHEVSAYVFSWAGALYDLSIPFLLMLSSTRWLAYVGVVAFHLITWSMFQIGMFPFIMIGATLIFFSGGFHARLHKWMGLKRQLTINDAKSSLPRAVPIAFSLFFIFQLLFPFRYLLYPGNPYWHEQGYRFGWRVMLVEKAGYAQFRVEDEKGRSIEVDNRDFLTPVQEKMMSTQPDFMLQYADHLKNWYTQGGVSASSVKADVYVTYNGRSSRPFIDNTIDLASVEDGWHHKDWIIPFER